MLLHSLAITGLLDFEKGIVMTRTIAITMVFIFIFAGLLGIAVPSMFGLHLGSPCTLINLISGCLALYFGSLILPAAKSFCKAFGTVFLLWAAYGFAANNGVDNSLFVSKHLALGTVDNIAHCAIGALFLIAGYYERRIPSWPLKTST
jgi:hypothetical protein